MLNILVRYRGPNTIGGLLAQYDRHLVDDLLHKFPCDLTCDSEVEVETPDIPEEVMSRGTKAITDFVESSGRRCLNIPETLACGLLVPETRLVCLGQAHRGPCMDHALVVYLKSASFSGFCGKWRRGHHVIPVTRATSPPN